MRWRLLLIDDEDTIRLALRIFFNTRSHEVDEVRSAEEALQALHERRYDAALLDLRLGAEGDEGLSLLSAISLLQPRPKLIVLTGDGRPDIEALALRAGADALFIKPLPLVQLEGALSSLLNLNEPSPTTARQGYDGLQNKVEPACSSSESNASGAFFQKQTYAPDR
jgi:DNA-binding response OmpR family regulator